MMLYALLLTVVPPMQDSANATLARDEAPRAIINPDVGVPVFPYDITERPYRVLSVIKVSTNGRGQLFGKEASQEKIYRNLWKRAQALGADAVVNVRYGDAHVSAFSFGKINATGTAIKFLAPGEAPAK